MVVGLASPPPCFDRPLSSITSSSSNLVFPASSKNCLDPEFLKAIPIMKTRSGMQVLRGWVQASRRSSPSQMLTAPASVLNNPIFCSLAVLLCLSQPRQPGELTRGLGLQQRRLCGAGLSAEHPQGAHGGGLHRRLLRQDPLHRLRARPQAHL